MYMSHTSPKTILLNGILSKNHTLSSHNLKVQKQNKTDIALVRTHSVIDI